MKKVTCLCIYTNTNKGYLIKSINVKHKYNTIKLFRNNEIYYKTFNDMYHVVLNVLKHNNYYVHKWIEFNTTWYDIDFLDSNTLMVDRYSYKEV